MVGTQLQEQKVLVDELAEYFHNNYPFLQIDTGTVLPTNTGTTLINGGTQIGNNTGLFNKFRETNALFTKLVDNISIMQFNLESGEPYNQPINIGSLGMMSQQTAGGGLGIAAGLPVTFTKTNELKVKIRGEFKILRIDEV